MNCTKEVMKCTSDSFDISLFESINLPGIEILNYGKHFTGKSKIIPIINNKKGMINRNFISPFPDIIPNGFIYSFKNFEYMSPEMKSNISAIIIKVNDICKETKFWEKLRAKKIYENKNHSLLLFKDIFSNKKTYICLIVDTESKQTKDRIDKFGFHVIAFLTNDIIKDLSKIRKYGYKSTCISSIILNNRRLHISFIYSPEGRLAEFIEIEE